MEPELADMAIRENWARSLQKIGIVTNDIG